MRIIDLGPNWYAPVMGTAIVANGAHALPARVPVLDAAAVAMWALSALLLAAVMAARAVHLARHRDVAADRLRRDPAAAVFYGCPPMALLAVGAATLAVGADVVGTRAAVAAALALWTAGTLYALAVAAGVPYLMMTRHELRRGTADPTWLLPLVAPMVAAATGPALVPHLPPGQPRLTLLYGCHALFGASLLATLAMLPIVWSRLLHDRLAPAALTPTLFLVLGPLGQSTTAAGQIADAASGPHAAAMRAFAVLYGVPVMGFALLWLAIAAALNVRARRAGMGFAMTWWSFTFPVGTCVTGAAVLARDTGLAVLGAAAVALWLLLAAAWTAAAAGTLRLLATAERTGANGNGTVANGSRRGTMLADVPR
ncbi:TDT family transporter [Actinomadura parmotrematis]|uniref:TDT family transporter n=1 Tax=Actinomadura parmotrematis TaxID=2864039 RepID=A0ABS7G699_9ACTN|nr:TDT family transporter [Actinomadura parmotrematis]MBW8487163.1 TDT family transporter [Actinomadura parmotrematis]